MKSIHGLIFSAMLVAAGAQAQSTIIAGDLGNPLNGIGSLPPVYGWAQQFTIASGVWSLTSAEVAVGDQYPGFPAVPVVQIRNATTGNLPGSSVLGTLTMNANNIPAWEFGVEHIAPVSAPADSAIILGPGTYWLCMMNFALQNSQGEIFVGFANTTHTRQSGAVGNVINVATLATWDGATFSHYTPTFANQTLLVQLDGQSVPEPSAWALAGLGAFGLRALRRQKFMAKG